MSMSITPVELVLYVEFVAAVQITTGAIPSEREEKTLHSVARMMLTYSTRAIQENSGELETSLTRVKEIVALIEPYSANGSRFSDALMELVVSHGVEGGACRRALAERRLWGSRSQDGVDPFAFHDPLNCT